MNPPGYTQPNTAIASFLMIAIPAAIIWFTKYEYVGYGLPGKGVFFKSNRPTRQAVETFLAQIHAAKVTYLRDLYLDKAGSLPLDEELRRLMWLKDLGALETSEFEARRQKLSNSNSTSSIGFHH